MNEPLIGEEAAVAKCSPVSEAEKAQWAKRFEESNLSLRKFGAQNGLCYMSVWRWVNKTRGKAASVSASAGPGFVEIKLATPGKASDWVAELGLPDGKVLRLSKDVPAPMLEQLLRVC